MGRMRVAHSFWVKPTLKHDNSKLEQTLRLFAISLSYLKRLNIEVVLHTDSEGLRLFQGFEYDSIYTTLDYLNENNISPRFWAAGKIIAQRAEPLGSIHIDGDVFLKTQDIINLIDTNKADVLTQNLEDRGIYKDIYYYNLLPIKQALGSSKPIKLNYDATIGYCCGVVRFCNADLKSEYIDGYITMMHQLNDSSYYMQDFEKLGNLCPDLVIEQLWLAHCSNGYNSSFIFEDVDTLQQQAVQIGYQHLLGHNKYSDYSRYMAEKTLQQLDSNLYEIIKKTIYNG